MRHPILQRALSVAAASTVLVACASGSGAAPRTPIALSVDVTEAPRRILHAKLVIPVNPGPLTLLYPKWIPGEHGPTGPILNLAGLKLSAAGKPVAWHRDNVEMYAFHCEVPAGATTLEVELDFLPSASTDGFSSAASATPELVDLSWNQLLLYPEGRPADEWTYTARLRLPSGWKYGTALPVATASDGSVEFKPVSLTTLVDSPVIAGRHFRTIDLSPGEQPTHEIHLVADSHAALEMTPQQIAAYKHLVKETGALFGARHYKSYHFLYTLSDHVGSFGLEHHESSDDRLPERTLIDDNRRKESASLLPHEFVHSWNGKYRRPSGLLSPDFQKPMKGDLLWIYEGLTEYLGDILTARSGLASDADYREQLAYTAAMLESRPGRTWRPLADTAVAAQILYAAPNEWDAWRRDVDFYDEGELIWLEADAIIRQKTKGQRSLDDFCKRFYGGASGDPGVKPYEVGDVVSALGEIAPNDWRALFDARLNVAGPRAPLGGIAASGWKLVYNETPNEALKARESVRKNINLVFSLGFWLKEDGTIGDVVPGAPAAVAGVAPGMKLIAVKGRKWSPDILHDALKGTKTSSDALELLLENGEFYKTFRIAYSGGERYPHLVRDTSLPDLLTEILKPRVPRPPEAQPSKPAG